MNERIQNLSKKAWLLAHEANDQAEEDEGQELTETEFNNVFQQKFAELIVKECADLFDDDPESGTRYTGVGCRDMIKWYFGVKNDA